MTFYCAMQWDHVEVTGSVFSSGENGVSILGHVHGRRSKVDGAAMGTEFRNRNKRQVDFVKLVTSTCLAWEVTEVEAISCLGLHGAAISATQSDTIGGILGVCALVVCWDRMIGGTTIQCTILGIIVLAVFGVLGDLLTWIPF